jgi:hypothetical protein
MVKLFSFLIILGSLANAKLNLNALLAELEEFGKGREPQLNLDIDSADEFGPGPIGRGTAQHRGNVRFAEESGPGPVGNKPRPNVGHGLRKEGESKISYENQMDVPMWVQFDCDRQLVASDTTKYTEEFSASYKGATASGSFSQEETKEYMYELANKSGKYSQVGPHDYLEEKTPSDCMSEMVYVTILNFGTKGAPNFFLNVSGMGQGEQVVVSGHPDTPHSEKDFNICFGEDCGCENGWCWSYCDFGWCYTTEGGTQSGDYVKCTRERDCKPDWHCGGACSAGRL